MRNVIAFAAFLIVICACSQGGGQPRLEPLARGLAEAWQPSTRDLKLAIHAEKKGERVTLHCVLQNTSTMAIEVDASTLPWITPGFFFIDAVGASGRVTHRNANVVQISSSTPEPVTIASGESMQGDVDLGSMPIGALPRREDMLLLWSYGLRNGGSGAYYFLSGITLLERES